MDGQPGLAVTGLSFHDLIGTRTQPDVALDQLFVDMAKFNERIMGATHVEDVADLVCRAALAYRGVAPSRLPRGSAGSARAERPVEGKRRPSHLRHRGAERSSSRCEMKWQSVVNQPIGHVVRQEVSELLRRGAPGRFLCLPCLVRLVQNAHGNAYTRGQIDRSLATIARSPGPRT